MTKRLDVEPGWVLYNEQLYHVSEFSHLPPRERPQAICPICEQTVVLKLGQVRAHHYAHREEVICTANQPETALHLNTKFYLYEELLRAARLGYSRLYIDQKCSGLGCPSINRIAWSQGWDDVRVEHRMHPVRPDIVLMRGEKVLVAIEVLVTHAVDQSKAALFEKQKIAWLEVPASESLYEGEAKWTVALPLPFSQCGPS